MQQLKPSTAKSNKQRNTEEKGGKKHQSLRKRGQQAETQRM